MSEPVKEVKPRKKRRVPGTKTPPRVAVVVRFEKKTVDAINELLKNYDGSRNDYICAVINADLRHRKRFSALNAELPANLDLLGETVPKAARKVKTPT